MDDEPDIRRVGERVLKHLGYDTVTVTDGDEAIAAYREAAQSESPFVAVILDLTIPGGMGGVETMQQLITLDPEVKGIVSSGYSSGDVESSYEAYGFVAAVSKPYEIATLKGVLERLLGAPAN